MPRHPRGPIASHEKTVLEGGIRVVTGSIPGAASVGINAFVLVGSRYEPLDQAGISHFVEHMLFKGTARRPTPLDISGTVESLGGEINAGTEQELTAYWCRVARPHLDECLDLLIDMLRSSVVDPEELERERGVILEEQNMINDYPQQKVDLILDDMLWPNHPLGRDISGTRDAISSMTRDSVIGHVRSYYAPANIVVSVAGDVEHRQVVNMVAALARDWGQGEEVAPEPFTPAQNEPQLRIEYASTEQSNVAIGFPGLPVEHPDRFALDLLSTVLGEGMSSRLFVEIRERLGLAYDVHSGAVHFKDSGALLINAGVDSKRAHEAVRAILNEVALLREGVPEKELERAKRMTIGRMMLRLEGTREVAGWIGSQEALLGRVSDVGDMAASIEAVSASDINRVAADVLRDDKLNLAVVGRHRGGARFERLLSR